RRGKYTEARPYADAAAETWAGWAMQCAQRCAEAQRDHEAAEHWARACSERYPNTCWSLWFEYCARTGHGDFDAARDWTFAYAGAVADQYSGHDLLPIACVYLLGKDRPKAIATLRRGTASADPTL